MEAGKLKDYWCSSNCDSYQLNPVTVTLSILILHPWVNLPGRESNANISTFSAFLKLLNVGSSIFCSWSSSFSGRGDGERRPNNAIKYTKTSHCLNSVKTMGSWGIISSSLGGWEYSPPIKPIFIYLFQSTPTPKIGAEFGRWRPQHLCNKEGSTKFSSIPASFSNDTSNPQKSLIKHSRMSTFYKSKKGTHAWDIPHLSTLPHYWKQCWRNNIEMTSLCSMGWELMF